MKSLPSASTSKVQSIPIAQMFPGKRHLHGLQRHGVDAVRGGTFEEEARAERATHHQLVPQLTCRHAALGRRRPQYRCLAYCQTRFVYLQTMFSKEP